MKIVEVDDPLVYALLKSRAVDAVQRAPAVTLVRAGVSAFALFIAAGCGAEQSGDGTERPNLCPEHQRYRQGMRASSERGASMVIVSAEPSAPAAGLNKWRIEVTDSSGAPVADASVTATLWMPAHSHPAPEPVVTPLGSGTYDLHALNFIMPGLWQVTITLRPASGQMDRAVFELCVEG